MLQGYGMLQPVTLEEALGALAGREDVLPLAGGTNVVMAMREGHHRGSTLMDVTRLAELRGTRLENGHVVAGGGATAAQLLDSAIIAERARPLYQALLTFANPLIRSRATMAGNIADASPAADTYPPLLVLDAEVELGSAAGRRYVLVDQFVVGPNQTLRRPDELIISLRWPVPGARSAGAFHKLALRKGSSCSVLSVAVMVDLDREGSVSRARIGLGAVAPRPIRAYEAEKSLVGRALTADAIQEAARLAADATQPIDDVRSKAGYRRRITGVLTRRLLEEAAGELGGMGR